MARRLRVEYSCAIYHVTVRSNGGAKLYRDDTDRECWLHRLGDSTTMHKIRVHLFCNYSVQTEESADSLSLQKGWSERLRNANC